MRVLVVVATKYRRCIVSTKKITKSELRFVKKQDEDMNYNLPLQECIVQVAPFLEALVRMHRTNDVELFETPMITLLANEPEEHNIARALATIGYPEDSTPSFIEELTAFSMNQEIDPFMYLSEVEEKEIDWFVKDVLQSGANTIIAGLPEGGKSTVVTDLIAQVTVGGSFLGTDLDMGSVIYIAGEDKKDSIIKPKIRSAGGDSSKVSVLRNAKMPKFPDNINQLVNRIVKVKPRLIVIDPLMDTFGGDNNSEKDVREALSELTNVADFYNLAIVIIHHIGKKRYDNPVHRLLGSQGWGASVRNVIFVAKDLETDDRYFSVAKNNNGKEHPSFKFKIEDHEGFSMPRVKHLGTTDIMAQDIGAFTGDTLQEEIGKDIENYIDEVGRIEANALKTYFSNDDRVTDSMKTYEYARAELTKAKKIFVSKTVVDGKLKTYYTSPEYQKGGVANDRQEEKD